jgi:hypothetical protein
MALTAWENAEQALAKLYLVLTHVNEATAHNAIRRTYGSIESNTGRRHAVMAVAEVYFSPYFGAEFVKRPFDERMLHVQQAAKRRDDVVHGHAFSLTVDGKSLGHFLFPVEYNNSRSNAIIDSSDSSTNSPFTFLRGHFRYTADDIRLLAYKFSQLRNAIYEFMTLSAKKDGHIKIVSEGLEERLIKQQQQDHRRKERKELHQQRWPPSSD